MDIGLVIALCVLSFVAGEFAMLFIVALLSAGKEDDNCDERKEER